MTRDNTPEQNTQEKAPLWAKAGLVGGAAVALAAGLYMDKHEVESSDEAVFSITMPIGDGTLTHVDEPEVVAGALGLGGFFTAVISADRIITHRRRR